MDRVFLDANVLYSAADREAAGLQRLWKIPDARLLTSPYAIEEALRNLESDEQQGRLNGLLAAVELVTALPQEWNDDHGLPLKDVPILQAAVAGGATHLLTGDARHFGLHYGTVVQGVLIQRPRDYPPGEGDLK